MVAIFPGRSASRRAWPRIPAPPFVPRTVGQAGPADPDLFGALAALRGALVVSGASFADPAGDAFGSGLLFPVGSAVLALGFVEPDAFGAQAVGVAGQVAQAGHADPAEAFGAQSVARGGVAVGQAGLQEPDGFGIQALSTSGISVSQAGFADPAGDGFGAQSVGARILSGAGFADPAGDAWGDTAVLRGAVAVSQAGFADAPDGLGAQSVARGAVAVSQAGFAEADGFGAQATGTAAAVRQSATGKLAGGSWEFTVTVPGVAAGSVLVACVSLWEAGEDGLPATVTSSPALAFTRRVASGNVVAGLGSDGETATIWTSAAATTAGSHTVTVEVGGFASATATVLEVTGLDAADPLDVSASATGNSTTPTSGSAGPSTGAGLAVAALVLDTGAASFGIQQPSGWTSAGRLDEGQTGMGHSADWRQVASSGLTLSAGWGPLSAGVRWGGAVAVLRAAASADRVLREDGGLALREDGTSRFVREAG